MPGKRRQRRQDGGGEGEVVSDPRFTAMHSMPVFKKMKKDATKVKLDDRFKSVLTDKRFQAGSAKVDKYGRKKKKKSAKKDLEAFYKVDDEEGKGKEDGEKPAGGDDRFKMDKLFQDAGDDGEPAGGGSSDSDEEEEPAMDAEARMEYLNALARGEVSGESDSDSDSDEDESDEDAADGDEDEGLEVGDDANEMGALARQGAEREEDIPMGDATRRVAILNCDWRNMRAVDILAVLQSFTTGTVRKVTVYPSDYGLEQMAIEDRLGPQGIWGDSRVVREDLETKRAQEKAAREAAADEESEDEDLDEPDVDSEDDEDAPRRPLDDDDDSGSDSDDESRFEGDFERENVGLVVENETTEDGFDREKLREYEVRKLRYYFAVAECEKVGTAEKIYDECSGLEFESSSSRLDIRFVPSDQDFSERKVRDAADAVPDDYDPPVYVMNALQNSNITCTWDEDDVDRLTKLTSYQSWAEMNEDDLAIYMASDESSDEDEKGDNAEKRKRLRELLLGGAAGDDDDDDDDDSDVDGEDGEKVGSFDFVSAPAGGDEDMSIYNVEGEAGAAAGDEDSFFMGADDDGMESGNKEMTFTAGQTASLEERMAKKAAGEEEETLTPYQQYQEKKKLKRRQKRLEAKERRRVAQLESDGKFREERDAKDEAESGRVKIADVVANESDNDFDMHEIQRAERYKGKNLKGIRKKKEDRRAAAAANGAQSGFELDTKDNRFAQLFDGDADFGIDRTSANFKDTEATREILREQRRRRKYGNGRNGNGAAGGRGGGVPAGGRGAHGRDNSAKAMAARLKAGAMGKNRRNGKKKNRIRKKKPVA